VGSIVRSSSYVTCMVGSTEDEPWVAAMAVTTFDDSIDVAAIEGT